MPVPQTVGAYLIYSYLYYELNVSLIHDADYDAICRKLLEDFDAIRHPHKHLLSRNALRAGTAYHLRREDYPAMAVHMAQRAYACHRHGKPNPLIALENYTEVFPVRILFRVRKKEFLLTSDAYNFTLSTVRYAEKETKTQAVGDIIPSPIANCGSLSAILSRAVDHVTGLAEVEDFKALREVVEECRADIAKVRGTLGSIRKEVAQDMKDTAVKRDADAKKKKKKPEPTVTSPDEDFDLDIGLDDEPETDPNLDLDLGLDDDISDEELGL